MKLNTANYNQLNEFLQSGELIKVTVDNNSPEFEKVGVLEKICRAVAFPFMALFQYDAFEACRTRQIIRAIGISLKEKTIESDQALKLLNTYVTKEQPSQEDLEEITGYFYGAMDFGFKIKSTSEAGMQHFINIRIVPDDRHKLT